MQNACVTVSNELIHNGQLLSHKETPVRFVLTFDCYVSAVDFFFCVW
jgi:hypothetical protein